MADPELSVGEAPNFWGGGAPTLYFLIFLMPTHRLSIVTSLDSLFVITIVSLKISQFGV